MKISNESAIAGLNAILAQLNIDGAGRIDIMDGTKPTDVSVTITDQNVIGSPTLNATAFPTAVDNVGKATATANAIIDGTASRVGTGTWFRSYGGDGVARIDGTVGLATDLPLPEIILSKKVFAVNDIIQVDSWVVNLYE